MACVHGSDEPDYCPECNAASEAAWLREQLQSFRSACRAWLRYDAAIRKRVVDGAVKIMETGGGVAMGDDLDKLYQRAIGLTQDALRHSP